MATKIQVRRDTAANWIASNPVLSQGEPGMEVNTGKIKYGDGVTDWKDLAYSSDFAAVPTDGVNSNPWRTVKVEGFKEFDYQTPGHLKIHATITSDMASDGTGSATVDLAGKDIQGLLKSFNQGSSCRVYLNDDRNWAEDSFYINAITHITGTTYRINWNNILALPLGQDLTIQYYTRGTEDTRYDYGEYNQYYPNITQANTNQVVIDFSRGDGLNSQARADLISQSNNSTIHFWSAVGDKIDEERFITKVTNEGDIFTIHFEGAPLDIVTPTLTTFNAVPAKAQNGYETSYLYIDRARYPQLKDAINPYYGYSYGSGSYGSGYVIFNKGTPDEYNVTFNFNNNVNYEGHWELDLHSSYVITPTTTLEINYYSAPVVMSLYIYMPDQSSVYYGKKWFDWHKDMPQTYFNKPGNGVQGGTMMVSCAVYDVLKNSWNWQNYSDVRFSTVGNNTYFNHNNGYFSDSSPFDNNDEQGLYFWSNYTGWGESRQVKVRILYSMDLMVTDNYYTWYC